MNDSRSFFCFCKLLPICKDIQADQSRPLIFNDIINKIAIQTKQTHDKWSTKLLAYWVWNNCSSDLL